jgi:hypothetical protein
MKQLNIAATFAAATVLTVFSLTCWVYEGQPFKSPGIAIDRMKVMQDDAFGGRFGIRGPAGASQASIGWPAGMVLDKWPEDLPRPVRYIR